MAELKITAANFENEVLANVNIRRALATSINKDAIAKTVLNNGSQAANYLVGYNLCFAPDEKTQMRDTNGDDFLAYDMESAKQDWQKGLEELGKDSITLRLMYYNNNDASIAQAEYIASQWQQTLPGPVQPLPMHRAGILICSCSVGDRTIRIQWHSLNC